MEFSLEFRTIVNCSKYLEVALQSDRDVVHFLNCEGFVTQEVCDDVLNPRSMLTRAQKAGELVTGIRNMVSLSPQHYSLFVEHLCQNRSRYGGIVDILDREYQKQRQKGQSGPQSVPVRVSHVFSRYGQYLRSYYRNNPIMRDDKLAIAPCSEFINLALIVKRDENRWQKKTDKDSFSIATFHGGVDEILALKSPLEMDAILTPNTQSVLVEGPPGIGKSTLCWELCRQWDTLKSLQGFKLVLQLKLRDRRVQNATTLNEIFFHRDAELCKSVVSEVFACEGEGVLLIFDGFDELPTCIISDASSLIMELLGGICLPGATRLVTSRPSALHLKKCFPRHYTSVEILGFTEKCKIKFAEEAFRSDIEILAHYKRFILSNPVINSLMYIPVNCAIISQVYEDIRRSDKPIPKTMTQLYTTLVLVLIRRHMIENGRWDEHYRVPDGLGCLPEEISVHLEKVTELAWCGLLKEEAQLVFSDSEVGEGFQHFGLLTETKEMYVCEGARTSYSFLHLSIQEFLAAWYLSCHPNMVSKIMPQIISYNDISTSLKHLSAFGQFLAGMIGCEKLKLYWYDTYHLSDFKLRCLYEAQRLSTLNTSRRTVSASPSANLASQLDMYMFGYILTHAPLRWELTFSAPFDMLVSSLADHARSDGKILGSIRTLNLYHYTKDTPSRLEDFPRCLLLSITDLKVGVTNNCIPLLIKDMSTLHNLQGIYLDFEDISTPNDYLLYQSLPSTSRELEFHFYEMTTLGAQQLSRTIAKSEAIEGVVFRVSNSSSNFKSTRHCLTHCDFRSLIESSLSCPTLTKLDVTIPVQTFSSPLLTLVKEVHFGIRPSFDATILVKFFDCLFSIADLCKTPSLKKLRLGFHLPSVIIIDYPPQVYCKFLSILNHSLHCNPSVEIFLGASKLYPICHIPIGMLSLALRQDQSSLIQKLQRAKSLCDLTTVQYVDESRCGWRWRSTKPQRTRSFGDRDTTQYAPSSARDYLSQKLV